MKTLIIFLSAIILAAIGDGCMDSGFKVIGHSAESISILILLLIPFLHHQKRIGTIGWYLAAYILIRAGVFDLVYNIVRGLPLTYHGTTSIWDMFVGLFNPPMAAELIGRILLIFAGSIISIQNLK